MTEPKILHWLNIKFGGAVYYVPAKFERKEYWRWQIRKVNDIRCVLLACYPYLVGKKEQVDIFIKLWNTIKSTGGCKIPETILQKRDDLYLRMKSLYCKKGRQHSVKNGANSVNTRTVNAELNSEKSDKCVETIYSGRKPRHSPILQGIGDNNLVHSRRVCEGFQDRTQTL